MFQDLMEFIYYIQALVLQSLLLFLLNIDAFF